MTTYSVFSNGPTSSTPYSEVEIPAPKSRWVDISTAPKDGSPVTTGKRSMWAALGHEPRYPITSRFIDGLWKANFGTKKAERWVEYDPQPDVWLPPRP